MRPEELTSWLIKHCSRQKLFVGCLTLASLQFLVYGFAYIFVHQFYNKQQQLTQQGYDSEVKAIYHKTVERFKLRPRDYGDVIVSDSSPEDQYLAREIEVVKQKFPKLGYFHINNTTVYDVIYMKPPSYLDSFKNPCFTERSLRSLNHHTLQHIYLLRCLPYFFVAGFTKCGTTDFHARLSQHALVTSGWTKEPHWWDNMHGKNSVLGKYLDMYQTATDEVASYQLVDRDNRSHFPTIIGDFTPRLIWHGTDWRQDFLNSNHTEPRLLLPHKIKHLIPKAKVIILIRNPVHRLYSDYTDFMIRFNSDRQPPSPAHFHQLVSAAMEWWKTCIAKYSEFRCAYDSPDSLPPLDSVRHKYWTEHTADRLRIGIYELYVKEWMKIFPHKQFKVILLEEYMKDPLRSLSTEVLPFLNLDPFTPEEAEVIRTEDILNSRRVRLDPSLDRPMFNHTLDTLQTFYRPYNLKLFDLIQLQPNEDYL